MSQVFVARQPIFARDQEVAGYELLFRRGPEDAAIVLGNEEATASVVLNSLTEIGLERIVGSKTAWINVSREFVLSGLVAAVPAPLVGLEILEDQLIDERLLESCDQLKRRGYRLSLDDFKYRPSAAPLLTLVDVVKLDVLALGLDGITEQAAILRPHGVKLLAEKVETRAEHAHCMQAGCDLFQGYFFCKPEILSNRQIDARRLPLLQLLGALQDPDIQLDAIEALIARDIALSIRLLRYINSAFFSLRYRINSIRQALALLGLENIKQWATLTVFASVEDKPPELTVTALIRARFCELAGAGSMRADHSQLFTLGLFSVIDALLDLPMSEALASIPFSDDLRDALIARQGPLGALLECVSALESGDFATATALVPGAGELHLESIMWANRAAQELLGEAQQVAA